MIRRYIHVSVVILEVLLAGGCREERDRTAEVQVMIGQEVEKRLENYREIRLRRCREDRMNEAIRRTDSILLEEARSHKDTIGKPPKPLRPDRPALRPLLDTTPVRPLLPADTVKNRN